jgi:hypothetical protein
MAAVETTALWLRVGWWDWPAWLPWLVPSLSVFILARKWGSALKRRNQKSFIWWVVTRLMFLAAIGSTRNFAMFFVNDVLQVPNPATVTTYLTAVILSFF